MAFWQQKQLLLASCAMVFAGVGVARAADLAAPVVVAPPPSFATGFFNGVEFHAQGEVGFIGNSLNPGQGLNGEGYNFGSLTTDHADQVQLNQIIFNVIKNIDPKETGFALGFNIQGIYGSDERFFHYLGLADMFMGQSRNQLNVLQAYATAHVPFFTTGGIDVKAGLFLSPQGYETLDPSTTPFYSHSYTYAYGDTFDHTGIFTTTHINSTLDILVGLDTGNQTTIGFPRGDPNGQIAGFVGFALNNLADGKLTATFLSHIGPEQNYFNDPFGASKDLRYFNDAVITYKATDALTFATELNYTRDEFGVGAGPAEYYAAVGYAAYTFNKIFTLNARAEVARDTQNFFVFTPQNNSGNAQTELGGYNIFPPNLVAPNGIQGTTYSEFTIGLTIKPDVPKPFALVLIRPEIRYDRVLAGGPAYNNNAYLGGTTGSRDQFTFGGDLVVGF